MGEITVDLSRIKFNIIAGFLFGYSDEAIIEHLQRSYLTNPAPFNLLNYPNGKYYYWTGFIPSLAELERDPQEVLAEIASRRLVPGNFPDDDAFESFFVDRHVQVGSTDLSRWRVLIRKLRETEFSEVCKDHFFIQAIHGIEVWF